MRGRKKGSRNQADELSFPPWRNYRCKHYGPCLNFCAANDCQLACGRCRHARDRTFEELTGAEIFGLLRLHFFIQSNEVFEPDGPRTRYQRLENKSLQSQAKCDM